MGNGKQPAKAKDPKKVGAGRAGGVAKATNAKSPSKPSEKSAKRKITSPFSYSSDVTDDMDDNRPRRKRNMLDESIEPAASFPSSPVPKLSQPDTSIRIEDFPHIAIGRTLQLPITIQSDAGRVYRIAYPTRFRTEEQSFWNMLRGMLAEVKEKVRIEAFGTAVDSAQ